MTENIDHSQFSFSIHCHVVIEAFVFADVANATPDLGARIRIPDGLTQHEPATTCWPRHT
jgi:hypothetical protein